MWNGVTMFANNRRWRHGLAALAALALSASAWALEPGAPVQIEFLPPPMDGTISLGIYDDAGKLVRVLHHEAEITELTAGDNGLITQWDGKDEHGAPCPTGAYHARGVMVGELIVEGVDFIGNDWVDDNDAPRVRRITGLGTNANGEPVISATLPGQSASADYAITLKPSATPGEPPEPQLTLQPAPSPGPSALKPSAEGVNHTVWKIEGTTVQQASKKGAVLFTLPASTDNPPPVALAASATQPKLYVLYGNAQLQRLSGYDFTGVKPGAEPKELFENDIWTSDRYEQIASQLKFPGDKPFVPSPLLSVALVANPLFHNKPGTLQIQAGVDKEGSYLATTDGLPLCHISESKALLWAAIGQAPGSKAITLFDSDGAVVEQFQISNPAKMMAFDAGAIEWTAVAPMPTPAASPAASPTPPVPTTTPAPSVTPSATPSSVPIPAASRPEGA